MTPRFNLFFRWFARRFFRHFGLDDATVADALRELESQGSVIYVMRYASRLDYFLFNALFRREGLRLSRFANGIRFYYYRPFSGRPARWRCGAGYPAPADRSDRLERPRARHSDLAAIAAGSVLLPVPAHGPAALDWLRGRGSRREGKSELDLLEGGGGRRLGRRSAPVHVVPLALFWRKGPRARRRFLNLSYGAATRPSDLAKVTSFLTTYRGLFVKVGDPIDLAAFIAERRAEGQTAVARMVRRSILTFLYREEKVVEGPTLRPRHKVQEAGGARVAGSRRQIQARQRKTQRSDRARRAKPRRCSARSPPT